MGLYYEPSNRMLPTGVRNFVLGGLAAAIPLALGYAFALWCLPPTCVFMFLLFGVGLGQTLKVLARRGKLRSPRNVGRLALLVGMVAMYLQWSVYLTLRAGPPTPVGSRVRTSIRFSPAVWASLLASPAKMVTQISQLSTVSIDTDNRPFSPRWTLVAIWIVEAWAIIGIARSFARSQAQVPFSEATDMWAVMQIMPRPVNHVRDVVAMRTALEAGHFEALVLLPTKATVHQMLSRPPGSFARLKLHSAPGDASCHYLTLENFIGKRRKGSASFDVATVVEYLHILPATYDELQARFGSLEYPSTTRKESG
jgi:hypothetical protein